MDIMTVIGFVLGTGLFYFGMAEGGMKTFFNLHGIVLVFGGTLAMTLVNSTGRTLWNTLRASLRLFFPQRQTPLPNLVASFRAMAERVKTDGITSLQDVRTKEGGGFLQRALQVALLSGDPQFTRDVLDEEMLQMKMRHQAVNNVFRTAGVVSPMFGLLGTLIGIVAVLQQITDPNKVGPAMAMALSTAFFGILLAAFFAIPMAGKLHQRSIEELIVSQLIIEGVIGILRGEAPYLLEARLRSFAREKGVATLSRPGGESFPKEV